MHPRFPVRLLPHFAFLSLLSLCCISMAEQSSPPGLVATLKGHQEAASGVAFSPDGKRLLTGSFDHTLKLWDIASGREIRTYSVPQGQRNMVLSVAFSPDGKLVASGSGDNVARLWDVPATDPVRFLATKEEINGLALSPDGSRLATAGKDGLVRVFAAADFKMLFELKGHTGPVTSVSFSGNGQNLASSGRDRTVRLWNMGNGKAIAVLGEHSAAATAVLVHPNNSIAYSVGEEGALKSWPIPAAPAPVRSTSPGAIHALTLTANGAQVLTAGPDKAIRLWNAGSSAKEREIANPSAVDALAVSKNNVLLAVGGDDKTVRVFTLADGKELKAAPVSGRVKSLVFSPNNQILAAGCADGSLQVWSAVYNPGQPPSPDFLKPLQSFTHRAAVTGIAIAPDNVTVYTASLDRELRAWRLAAEGPTKNFGHPNLVDVVTFSPDGKRLVTGCHDGKVRLFDVAKGAQLKEISASTTKDATMIYALAWSPDGKQLVSGGFDNSLRLWNAESGALIRELKAYKPKESEKGHRDSVLSVAFSPDGQYLASGSGGLERLIKIWKVADGSLVRDLDNPRLKHPMLAPQSHPGWVNGLRFTKDGKRLISAGDAPLNRGYLAVWDVPTGKLLYGEELPLGNFHSLALAPDEKLLALGAGSRGRAMMDLNLTYLLRMPPEGRIP
jgi:WD40 repeat protein